VDGGHGSVRGGAKTRKHAGRVKGCCTKQRKDAPRVKAFSAVRRHAGGLHEARSYHYAHVKRVKPFIRDGKGVIWGFCSYPGPPINRVPLVIGRTHINEKRAQRHQFVLEFSFPEYFVPFLSFWS
jgi:hypothetical protein